MLRHQFALVCILSVAACAFHPGATSTDAGSDDADGSGSIIDDTQAELAAGTVGEGATIIDGTVELSAYIGGGLRGRGCLTNILGGSGALTWDGLETACATSTGTGYAVLPTDWGNDRPLGVGLGAVDHISVLFDGEVFLPAGAVTVKLDPDDIGFLEIADDGVTFSAPISGRGVMTVTVHPATPGYYPIHAAIGEDTGSMFLKLTAATTDGTAIPLSYRYDVTREPGISVVQYAPGFLPAAANQTPAIAGTPVIGGAFGKLAPPYDLTENATAEYALRYVGQLHIADGDADDYALRITKDMSAATLERVWLDGVLLAEDFAITPYATTYTPQHLDAGWHDLIVDTASSQKTQPDASFALSLARGSGDPQDIPATQLRPVMAGGETVAGATGTIQLNAATISAPVPLPMTPGFTIDAYDIVFNYGTNTLPANYQVELDEAGTKLVDVSAASLTGTLIFEQDQTAVLGGQTIETSRALALKFTYVGSNQQGGETATFSDLITTGHGSRPAPFARTAHYLSAVHDTPGATAITGAKVAHPPFTHGETVSVLVRTGADADHLGDFTAVDAESGANVPAGAVLQYEIVIQGDGWHAPSVDSIEIDYRTSP